MPRWNGTDCCKSSSAKTVAACCKLHVSAAKSERSLTGAQCVRALPSLISQPTLAVAVTSRLISCWFAHAALYSAPQRVCTHVLVSVVWGLRWRRSPATLDLLRVPALACRILLNDANRDTTAAVCSNNNRWKMTSFSWYYLMLFWAARV